MDAYVAAWFATASAGQHAKLYQHVDTARDRFAALLENDPAAADEFRSALRDYTRMYAFLAQVIPFHDAELERLYLYGKALLTRLPRTNDGGVDIGSVEMSHLRITKTGEHNASLTPDGAQMIEGFTGGGVGPQNAPEKAPLETIIDQLNERLGGILTDADKLWVQQSFEFAAEDESITAAAKVNSEENFGYVFDGQFQDLVLTRHDQNAELIARVFADSETTEFFTRLARRAVWEMAQKQATSDDKAV
jgi:type I restriction enzyme R subunit